MVASGSLVLASPAPEPTPLKSGRVLDEYRSQVAFTELLGNCAVVNPAPEDGDGDIDEDDCIVVNG